MQSKASSTKQFNVIDFLTSWVRTPRERKLYDLPRVPWRLQLGAQIRASSVSCSVTGLEMINGLGRPGRASFPWKFPDKENKELWNFRQMQGAAAV